MKKSLHTHKGNTYELIETQEALQQFADEHKSVKWMGFDTEFIGERRFHTLLCVVQVSSPLGFFIIDAIKLKRLDALFDLLKDEAIIKITHAGENDYRLLYQQYGIVPQNLFDTQIAAGFLGYRYPLSFAKLVSRETNRKLRKGFTVSNWESRPLTPKQIEYALEDVYPLYELYERLSKKLEKLNRTGWLKEEIAKYEVPGLFELNPYKEAFQNNLIEGRSLKEQTFLLRLYKWRSDLAESRDHSREMVLPGKYISFILKNIRSGRAALMGHRRLPPDIVKKYWDTFDDLYQAPTTKDEQAVLDLIPPAPKISNREDVTFDLILNLIRFHCQKIKLAPELLFNGINIKRMRQDRNFFDDKIRQGWRTQILGEGIIHAMKNQKTVKINLLEDQANIIFRE